jgi:catechol 2,3-dioxygenase-like lactoylglutathione lyase family enzyme
MAKQKEMSFNTTAALSIPVRQFDKCIEFYNGVLGMTVYAQTEDKTFAALRAGEIDIWLIAENSFGQKFRVGNDSGPVFAVDDLEKVVNTLTNQGIRPVGGVVVWPGDSRHVSFRDPDGNLLTMFERADK